MTSDIHDPVKYCRIWIIERRDGQSLGFTDHDGVVVFNGVNCYPESGLEASALVRATGMSIDNTEAVGAITSEVVTAAEIRSGLYADATVGVYDYDWENCQVIRKTFSGSIGQIRMEDGVFFAELQGLSEKMSRPTGRTFQSTCDATLGDERCSVEIDVQHVSAFGKVLSFDGERLLQLEITTGPYEDQWFSRGYVECCDGPDVGRQFPIKQDRSGSSFREIELWFSATPSFELGSKVRIVAGCDKSIHTCCSKFDNVVNFRGFPSVPGEDWMLAYPSDRVALDGKGR